MDVIPNRRALAQQQRRAREAAERNAQVLLNPQSSAHESPEHVRHNQLDVISNRRALAQQQRRARQATELNTQVLMNPQRSAHEAPEHVRHNALNMDVICLQCGTLHWSAEKLSTSTKQVPKFGTCCLNGKVRLPLLQDPPLLIRKLLEGQDEQSKDFRKNIRQYNAAHAFTSLGVNVDDTVLQGRGPYCFRIHGKLSHQMGSLLPEEGSTPVYAQLYFYDGHAAHEARMGHNQNLMPQTMLELQGCLKENHSFYPIYRQARDILAEARASGHDTTGDIGVRLHFDKDTDRRRYNLPTSNEIAAFLPRDGTCVEGMRDIIIRHRGGPLQHIHEEHHAYLPLHYVLLFPRGEMGWHDQLMQHDDGNRENRRVARLTQMDFYSYRLFPRDNEFSTILRGGKLLQEFMVDAWAATEQNRLRYLRHNQDQLRADVYQGLADVVGDAQHREVELRNLGQRIILPSTHTGSGRNMFEIFQDSMAITRFFHHSDVFGTMTANPRWPKITAALLPDQTAADRPDILVRVFEIKRYALIEDVFKQMVLRKTVARVHTIEFQKRGLPHMHFLLFFDKECKIKEPTDVDKIVCSELPVKDDDPLLYETIITCMVHGPCGIRTLRAWLMEAAKNTTQKLSRNLHQWTKTVIHYIAEETMEGLLKLARNQLITAILPLVLSILIGCAVTILLLVFYGRQLIKKFVIASYTPHLHPKFEQK